MFHKCESKKEAKALFRKLSMFLHPDKGGDNQLMSLLLESYEMKCQFLDVDDLYEKMQKEKSECLEEDKILFDETFGAYEYLKDKPTDFIYGVYEYFTKNGFITDKQREYLERTRDYLYAKIKRRNAKRNESSRREAN